MKKRLIAAVTAILSITLLFGSLSFAAASPSTATATYETQSSEEVAALSGDGTEASVGTVTVSADYSTSTSGLTLVVSSTDLDETVMADLLEEINEALASSGYEVTSDYVIDVSLRYSDYTLYEGEADIFSFTFGVGNEYEGLTVVVYVWNADGTLSTYTGVVTNGKVTIDLVGITGLVRMYIATPVLG